MFTSQTLRAAGPRMTVSEQRLDEVVHLIEVRGPIDGANVMRIADRLDTALREGIRWCLLDLTSTRFVADALLPALVAAARELRVRRGELIVAGAEPTVSERLGAYQVSDRPALAANVDQALMILKMLRPKTAIKPAAKKRRTTSLTLPRVEPSH